jgi:hypothetical protein
MAESYADPRKTANFMVISELTAVRIAGITAFF